VMERLDSVVVIRKYFYWLNMGDSQFQKSRSNSHTSYCNSKLDFFICFSFSLFKLLVQNITAIAKLLCFQEDSIDLKKSNKHVDSPVNVSHIQSIN
jgi:hypothetical protein